MRHHANFWKVKRGMGKKNRERVTRVKAGLEKPIAEPKARVRNRCPFPGCTNTSGPPRGLCITHERFVTDLLFIMPHIRMDPSRAKSGLILPGSPEFIKVPVPGTVPGPAAAPKEYPVAGR